MALIFDLCNMILAHVCIPCRAIQYDFSRLARTGAGQETTLHVVAAILRMLRDLRDLRTLPFAPCSIMIDEYPVRTRLLHSSKKVTQHDFDRLYFYYLAFLFIKLDIPRKLDYLPFHDALFVRIVSLGRVQGE